MKWVAFFAFLGSLLAANVMSSNLGLVSIGFGLMVSAGSFAAGAALVARDILQEEAGRRAVAALIVAGALLSAAFGDGRIALASGLAFLISEFVDMAVYTPLRSRSWIGAVVASTVVAAPIDTVLFLWVSGFGVTWPAVEGQFLVKLGMALVAAGVLLAVRSGGGRAVHGEPQYAEGA